LLVEAVQVLAINETLPDVPDNNFNGNPDFVPEFGVNRIPVLDLTLPEKFALNPTDSALDQLDIDFLVQDILQTGYGDVDLDGDIDNDDLAIATGNLGGMGGWALGDTDGDGDVDEDDLALINSAIGGLPGDFNEDGSVDAADYVVWRNNFGGAFTPGDFTVWANNYGAAAPAAAAGAVPEPTGLALAALVALGLGLRGRR